MRKLHFILLCLSCILAACSTEPTEQAKKQMSELKDRLKKAVALLPQKGQEKVITPTKGSLPEDFQLKESSRKEELQLLQIDRRHLEAIVEGKAFTKDLKEKKMTTFSNYGWDMIDPDPFKNTSETKFSHEKNIERLYKKQYLRVTQIESYTPGETEGKTIKKAAKYKVWFWLIDLKNNKLVGAQSVEAESRNYIFSMSEKGKYDSKEALAGSAQSAINEKVNNILAEWAGKSSNKK